MGNRLSKISTRTGDDGTTGLGDGNRIDKDSLRIEAIGAVDETNSAIGMVLAVTNIPARMRGCLLETQHELFNLGGELATPGYCGVHDAAVERLERELEEFNSDLPPLKEFVLPGGSAAAAACHLARSIARRAERNAWALARTATVSSAVTRYLNRLSDLLFVLARVLARHENGSEVLWRHERS